MVLSVSYGNGGGDGNVDFLHDVDAKDFSGDEIVDGDNDGGGVDAGSLVCCAGG
eukprot:CAMPEP_0196571592 /NCGR_PEP_ID=MMETSP1081-20130531/1758_1 /TAXON_ID=36882 /ORGANISM="Pyramimonas amylifera, Strain CCMP720" /LENGTH=53 /DNA_ID=CAMNT_0041888601 /DNA_START=299 /DNA_END=457 /DNA_ORIENTATION=-